MHTDAVRPPFRSHDLGLMTPAIIVGTHAMHYVKPSGLGLRVKKTTAPGAE